MHFLLLGLLTCNAGGSSEKNILTSGSGATGITFSNPFMTQAVLDEIYQKIGGFTYHPMEVRFVGDFRIEPGDIITVQKGGVDYIVPVMQITYQCDGGLISTVKSIGQSDTANSRNTTGPATQKLKRFETELALVSHALVNKLDADTAEITYASIEQMKAVNVAVDDLKANMLTVQTADLKYAAIKKLDAADVRITALEAGSADVGVLRTQMAKLNTLMFGSASGGSLTTAFSNSVAALIGDAQIRSAMIKELAADKINAGKINTNRVEMGSESGNLKISDNTILIKDGNQTPRVQLGKDAAGDYSLYVWDTDKNLMFDARGLTAGGIQRAIIRDDMVSGDANISAGKLDINSLFQEINGSSQTIKSSKIGMDTAGQTLDVAFKTVQTHVSEAGAAAGQAMTGIQSLTETVKSQGTQLTAVQGQITSKVWQQDITTAVEGVEDSLSALEGSTTTLTNGYTRLNQTLTSLTATVNDNTTAISKKADGSAVTAMHNVITSLQADLSGFQSTVSRTYTTRTEFEALEETAAALDSAIKQSADSILQSVSATYATKNSLNGYAATQSVNASLALKIDKTDTGRIVSMINASADEINLKANRFSLDSTYSKINRDGSVEFTKGIIGGFTLTEKLSATAGNVYINPGMAEINKLRDFLMYIESPTEQEKGLYDLNGDSNINAYDLIAMNSIIQGITEYSSYKNAVTSTVHLQIDPTKPQELIKLWGTNPWGRKLEQRIGINGIDATAVRAEIVNAEELNLNGNPVIESGTVSNGFYIKFANGIMLCALSKEFINIGAYSVWGSFYETPGLSMGNFPVSFSGIPYVTAKVTNKRGTGSAAGFIEGPYDYNESSAGEIYICRPTEGNFDFIVDLIAAGTWK